MKRDRDERPPRVVKLHDLSPDEQRLVLALIAAKRAADLAAEKAAAAEA